MNYQLKGLKSFGVLITPEHKNTSIKMLNVASLRKLFYQDQLIVLRGFDTFQSATDFADYCEDWGSVSLWPFGKVLELVEQDNPEDHIFDHSDVPLHWDGMYRPEIPEYQIFHCVKAPLPGYGGRTTFSNTILALEKASSELKALWHKVTGIYQRKMAFYNSKTVSPIITKHPQKNFSVLRYNEPHAVQNGHFINPPILTFEGLNNKELDLFHDGLKQALYDPFNFYAHTWQTGDVVIADNFSLLHGREGFISKSPRHIQRVHVLSDPPFINPGLESYQ